MHTTSRHTPAVNAAQVNVRSTGDVQVIVREAGPGEPWFQMLRREFENGTWPALADRHRALLPVMCALRDRDTGAAYAPMHDYEDHCGAPRPGLMSMTGLGRSQLYLAIAEMTTDPAGVPLDAPGHARAAAGLLARCGRDLYAVLPDRVFAGRRKEPAAVPAGGPRVRPPGLSSGPPDEVSARADRPALALREARARSNQRIENSSSTTTMLADPDMAEAVRMLEAGLPPKHRGFGTKDAEKLLARTGVSVDDVRTAVANAAHKAGSREGLRTWTGYVRTQLEQGCTLFPVLQRQQDHAARATDRLRRLASELGDEATCGALTAWYARQPARRIAALVASSAWHGSDTEFWAEVARTVSREQV